MLRPYQIEAVSRADALIRRGGSPLVVHATGTGKTISMAEVVRLELARGGSVLVLAQRREAVRQCVAALRDVAGLDVGTSLASWGHRVMVVTPAHARRWLSMVPRVAFSLVVIDEAHHAAAPGHRVIVEWFGCPVVGFTATPYRLDGAPLPFFLVHEYGLGRAVAEGYLVPARAVRVLIRDMDLSAVRTVRRDLHPKDLGKAVMACVPETVRQLVALRGDRKTIVYAVNRVHMLALWQGINDAGVPCGWVDGTMKKADRDRVLEAFARGEFRCLVNVLLLTESYDHPAVECVAMVRPTQSWTLMTQVCGRGLRPSPATGKRECLFLDFTNNRLDQVLASPETRLVGALVGEVVEVGDVGTHKQENLHLFNGGWYTFIYRKVRGWFTR